MEVTPQEVMEYVRNRENFTEQSWERLQEEKQKIIERLARELDSVTDIKKTSKRLREKRRVDPRWLYVK